MTYENVVSWCEKNLPQEDYDNFREWYDACYDKVNTPSLFENPDFNRMMEDSWLGSFGTFEPRSNVVEVQRERSLESFGKTPEPKKPEPIIIMPKTGSAPVIPKPTLVFPNTTPEKQKESLFSRFKNFVLRRKK